MNPSSIRQAGMASAECGAVAADLEIPWSSLVASDRGRLALHLARCPACRGLRQQAKAYREVIREGASEIGPDLVGGVLSALARISAVGQATTGTRLGRVWARLGSLWSTRLIGAVACALVLLVAWTGRSWSVKPSTQVPDLVHAVTKCLEVRPGARLVVPQLLPPGAQVRGLVLEAAHGLEVPGINWLRSFLIHPTKPWGLLVGLHGSLERRDLATRRQLGWWQLMLPPETLIVNATLGANGRRLHVVTASEDGRRLNAVRAFQSASVDLPDPETGGEADEPAPLKLDAGEPLLTGYVSLTVVGRFRIVHFGNEGYAFRDLAPGQGWTFRKAKFEDSEAWLSPDEKTVLIVDGGALKRIHLDSGRVEALPKRLEDAIPEPGRSTFLTCTPSSIMRWNTEGSLLNEVPRQDVGQGRLIYCGGRPAVLSSSFSFSSFANESEPYDPPKLQILDAETLQAVRTVRFTCLAPFPPGWWWASPGRRWASEDTMASAIQPWILGRQYGQDAPCALNIETGHCWNGLDHRSGVKLLTATAEGDRTALVGNGGDLTIVESASGRSLGRRYLGSSFHQFLGADADGEHWLYGDSMAVSWLRSDGTVVPRQTGGYEGRRNFYDADFRLLTPTHGGTRLTMVGAGGLSSVAVDGAGPATHFKWGGEFTFDSTHDDLATTDGTLVLGARDGPNWHATLDSRANAGRPPDAITMTRIGALMDPWPIWSVSPDARYVLSRSNHGVEVLNRWSGFQKGQLPTRNRKQRGSRRSAGGSKTYALSLGTWLSRRHYVMVDSLGGLDVWDVEAGLRQATLDLPPRAGRVTAVRAAAGGKRLMVGTSRGVLLVVRVETSP